ncbi:hypothetical protein ACQYWQ_09605 [Streptomyces sp. P6-2-1]|uniref:hypothetical protein n=1 Tax=unclassified Streptomyces TaxID=2593676 RepID=UPI003D35AE0C
MRLRDLVVREDREGEWIVGRMASRTFVAMPAEGVRALALLRAGTPVDEAARVLREETGEDFDVADFVTDLTALGFVARVGNRELPDVAAPRASLPRLRPAHVRLALHPALPLLVAALVAAALVVLVRRPELLPGYRDLLWTPRGSLVLLTGAAAGWTLLYAHELAHLVTARAAGVPGHIRLGTRLQFLVMQTDISGIELAPRRHRLTAYLAGIALNLSCASAALLALATTTPGSGPHRFLSAALLIALLPLPFQLMVFTRTDVYFVLQDLTGCRNLYGDGLAHARHLLRRLRPGGERAPGPSARLPARERRAVRVYSVVLVLGTAVCLSFLAAVTLPADVTLLAHAVRDLGRGGDPARIADAVLVLVILGGVNVLWAVTWWRGHRARARARAPRP